MAEDLDKVLERIRKLIAVADSTDNEHEADAFRKQADALMFQYRIEELSLGTPDQRANIVPIQRTMSLCALHTRFEATYRALATYCLSHVDAKSYPGRYEDGMILLDTFGYDSDLRYAEILFTSFSLAFAGRMDVRKNPALSDQENCYLLRMAGWDGGKVALELWGINDKAGRSRARRLFEAEALKRGENPKLMLGIGNSMDNFRDSYEIGFKEEARRRLRMMRVDQASGAIVLASRREAVEELYYSKYPHMRPTDNPVGHNALGGRDTCPRCKKAKSGYCRDHAYLRPRARDYKYTPLNETGLSAGRHAAASVDLNARAVRGIGE